MVPKAPILDRVNELERYITLVELAEAISVPLETLYNWRHKGRCGTVHRAYAQRVMAYQLDDDATTAVERVRGTQRIYRGLAVRGWNMDTICDQIGVKACGLKNVVSDGQRSKRGISKRAYAELKRIAGKLELQDPYDVLPAKSVNIVKGKARTWVDIGAWDMDTVHLEHIKPDVTGACGTMAGYYLHRNHDIPMCSQCNTARAINRRFPRLSVLMGVGSGTERPRRYNHDDVLILHGEGMSAATIAKELGAKRRTIDRIIARYV